MRKILVYGAKEFGQVVKNILSLQGHQFVGFIDDFVQDDFVLTYDEARAKYPSLTHSIVIAIGYKFMDARWRIYEKVKSDGYKVLSLIHPQAIVDKSAKIGDGVIIMAGAIVGYNAEIRDLAVLWQGAVVEHDSVIGKNTFLSPNSTVCGLTTIGRDCFIGAGAVVTDRLKILDNSFIKAGSVNNVSIRHN